MIEPSALSLFAAFFYAAVAGASIHAGRIAVQSRQARWHRSVFFAIAVLFAFLIAWRVLAVEDILREVMREQLRGEMVYDGRREMQRLIASAIIVLVALGGFALVFRIRASLRGRRNQIAVAAAGGSAAMVLLIALRLVSFHWIDAALYGPLKLNWFIDLGLGLAIMVAALAYTKVVRRARR
ncbi:hypothetical protein [Qipengyuania nanhaisediminis]|uniref:hypothetical protein n=1 Tax=Qipengyuania nanhaisediminis TaxID=604088 RepID=UPI0038B38A16